MSSNDSLDSESTAPIETREAVETAESTLVPESTNPIQMPPDRVTIPDWTTPFMGTRYRWGLLHNFFQYLSIFLAALVGMTAFAFDLLTPGSYFTWVLLPTLALTITGPLIRKSKALYHRIWTDKAPWPHAGRALSFNNVDVEEVNSDASILWKGEHRGYQVQISPSDEGLNDQWILIEVPDGPATAAELILLVPPFSSVSFGPMKGTKSVQELTMRVAKKEKKSLSAILLTFNKNTPFISRQSCDGSWVLRRFTKNKLYFYSPRALYDHTQLIEALDSTIDLIEEAIRKRELLCEPMLQLCSFDVLQETFEAIGIGWEQGAASREILLFRDSYLPLPFFNGLLYFHFDHTEVQDLIHVLVNRSLEQHQMSGEGGVVQTEDLFQVGLRNILLSTLHSWSQSDLLELRNRASRIGRNATDSRFKLLSLIQELPGTSDELCSLLKSQLSSPDPFVEPLHIAALSAAWKGLDQIVSEQLKHALLFLLQARFILTFRHTPPVLSRSTLFEIVSLITEMIPDDDLDVSRTYHAIVCETTDTWSRHEAEIYSRFHGNIEDETACSHWEVVEWILDSHVIPSSFTPMAKHLLRADFIHWKACEMRELAQVRLQNPRVEYRGGLSLTESSDLHGHLSFEEADAKGQLSLIKEEGKE